MTFYLAVVTLDRQMFEGPFPTAEDALRRGDRYRKDGINIAVIGANPRKREPMLAHKNRKVAT